ncbi:MAG: hypothetical protein WC774_01215 [Candidatus Gracilibacteria bacterium]
MRIAISIGIQTASAIAPTSTHATPLSAVNLLDVVSILSSLVFVLVDVL